MVLMETAQLNEMPISAYYGINHVALPSIMDINPDRKQFIDFLKNRGNQYLSMALECNETDNSRSQWYSEMSKLYWTNVAGFETYTDWTFSLWYEANVDAIEASYYTFEDYPVAISLDVLEDCTATVKNHFSFNFFRRFQLAA